MPASLTNTDRGGHYWFRFCDGQPDATPLPPDPRSLVTPTSDKAVVFNVSWFSCLNQQPATCGELRALLHGVDSGPQGCLQLVRLEVDERIAAECVADPATKMERALVRDLP